MIVVVGKEGLVARHLLAELRVSGEPCLGTSRRPGTPQAQRLDLAENAASWPVPENVSVAYLCAGITRLAPCEKDPAGSRRVNVDGMLTLARRLAGAGCFVVYLSTDRVFDGSRARRGAGEPLCPATEYGRQKAEADEGVRALGGSAAVVRLAKVVAPDLDLVAAWTKELRAGRPVAPFEDMFMAPMPARAFARLLIEVGRRRLSGVTQASGARDVSYAWAAGRLAARLGAGAALVRPVASGAPEKLRPRHTTFDCSRAERELGFSPPDPEPVIDGLA